MRLSDSFDEDTIDELIGPVCMIADLGPTQDAEMNRLVEAAKRIKAREGFFVHTVSLTDD
jgi:hypothetical protein